LVLELGQVLGSESESGSIEQVAALFKGGPQILTQLAVPRANLSVVVGLREVGRTAWDHVAVGVDSGIFHLDPVLPHTFGEGDCGGLGIGFGLFT
jgi:hypothetical protein